MYNEAHMEALIHLITGIGVLAILFVIFAESGLLIGFFLPGDSLLFTSGFLVQQNVLPINIHIFVFLLFIAAALGDSVGYTFGRRVGRKLFERERSRFFRPEHLKAAEVFYEKHGSKTIVLARFVPFVRTFAPIVAGASKMHYKTFLIFNLLGAAAWTSGDEGGMPRHRQRELRRDGECFGLEPGLCVPVHQQQPRLRIQPIGRRVV